MDLMNHGPNSPQQSIQDRPALQRQSSTSSSDSAESSHTRPRKAVRSSERRTSASGIQTEQSGSRRGSMSSMRTSSAPLEGPVTYTPTTHRISKAKKGKRVHACTFPGCNKIFTRAEHRRRHESNHSPEASYRCGHPECRKTFHRRDLWQRHQERHDLEAQTEGQAIGHRRFPSGQTSTSATHPMIASTTMTNPPMVPVQASSNGLSIPSLLHPQSSEGYGHGQHNTAFDFVPRTPFPMYTSSISASEDFIYSSPESSQSPLSDHYGFPHRNSISSSSSVVDFVPPNCASPLINTTASGWAPVLPPSATPSNCNHLEDDMAGFSSSPTDASIPISISELDGHERPILQRQLAPAPGAAANDDSGLEIFDLVKWQNDCLHCYWRHFHPLFPIVHQPTFSATSSASMTAVMIAIGSQYDTRTNAKENSLALLEACTQSLTKRDDIHSQSPLSDLQTVFLLEVLTKFRSRKTDLATSPRFRALFASLSHSSARHWVSTNPFAVLKGISKSSSAAELGQAHTFWMNRETRRRLLLGSLILDTQQAVLFGQQPVLFHRWPGEAPWAQIANLPCPCDNELWECRKVEDWAELSKRFEDISLSAAADPTMYDHPQSLDPFRSRLILAYLSISSSGAAANADVELAAFCEKLARHDLSGRYAPTEFDIHFHIAAQNTPIRSLLTVSGESWIFGKKLENECEFRSAKSCLREWVGSSNAYAALWHGTALLRMVFTLEPDHLGRSAHELGLRDREMNMLHEQWCIYIAALICWACAFDGSASEPVSLTGSSTTSTSTDSPSIPELAHLSIAPPTATAYPPPMDPVEADAEMRTFLQATDVDEFAHLQTALVQVRGRTKGLLEAVRTRKISGSLGSLLDEASGVLYRLVEGRSRLSHF